MAQPSRSEFGLVDDIDVETFGEPGQRTFRIIAEKGQRTASLWLEKEQLQALGLVIEEQLERTQGEAGLEEAILTLAARFPAQATIDFKVGRLAVGFDEQQAAFLFTAHDVERPEQEEPDFTCRANAHQSRALASKIGQIVAAGRPRCPLCGAPMDSNHVCPASNGRVH
jgi:uncharacterized repeat protein (TIGR03847 family)